MDRQAYPHEPEENYGANEFFGARNERGMIAQYEDEREKRKYGRLIDSRHVVEIYQEPDNSLPSIGGV